MLLAAGAGRLVCIPLRHVQGFGSIGAAEAGRGGQALVVWMLGVVLWLLYGRSMSAMPSSGSWRAWTSKEHCLHLYKGAMMCGSIGANQVVDVQPAMCLLLMMSSKDQCCLQ
jgi:hypothetical protein